MEKELTQILKEMIGIDFERRYELKDVKLLSDKIGLYPRDLVVLFVLVIKKFDIDIKEVDLNVTKFDTFNHILFIINHYSKRKDV